MKKILLIPILSLIIGCSNDKLVFDSESNIFFPEKETEYSWLRTTEDVDIIPVKCKIVGKAPVKDMTFKAEVVADKTTAVEGLHYEKLPDTFTWEKEQFDIELPVKIFNKDAGLLEKEVLLTLRLTEGGELGVNYEGNMEFAITISSQVIKPNYWDSYALNAFMGVYSKKKHSIIILLAGKDMPLTSKEYKEQAAYWQNFGLSVLNNYFKENPGIKDENGLEILPW